MGTGSPVNSLTLAAQIGWLLNMPKKDQNAVYDELSQLPEGPLKQAMTCLVNCVRSRYIACIRSESIRGAQYETTADSDFFGRYGMDHSRRAAAVFESHRGRR